jgi:hypothetical protein
MPKDDHLLMLGVSIVRTTLGSPQHTALHHPFIWLVFPFLPLGERKGEMIDEDVHRNCDCRYRRRRYARFVNEPSIRFLTLEPFAISARRFGADRQDLLALRRRLARRWRVARWRMGWWLARRWVAWWRLGRWMAPLLDQSMGQSRLQLVSPTR